MLRSSTGVVPGDHSISTDIPSPGVGKQENRKLVFSAVPENGSLKNDELFGFSSASSFVTLQPRYLIRNRPETINIIKVGRDIPECMDGFCREIRRARNIQNLEGIRHILLLVIKPSLPYELIAYSRPCTIRTYQQIV